ncbi:MAG: ATP-dependent DNA helicase [Gammaproteobacteria bacterium]|nr:ATP-dependent DNA helicase [Gammaproteobacteria bacterium]
MTELSDILGPEGKLSHNISGFSFRPQQMEMAQKIQDALADRSTLIVEAGTGTGKTFAYLTPALLSGNRILISTGTKTLQDQLFNRDIPKLCEALGVSPRVALLKGRQNYLCLHRMDKTLAQGRLSFREHINQLHEVREWSYQTRHGDISELHQVPETSSLWQQLTSTSDNCLGSDCLYAEKCYVNLARANAHKADVIVCNHHLFFSDMALLREGIDDLLPTVDAYIFDEAHQLAEIAHQFLGFNFSSAQIRNLISDVTTAISEHASDMLTEFNEFHQDLTRQMLDMQKAFEALPSRGAWTEFYHLPSVSQAITNLVNRLAVYCGHLEETSVRSTELNNCFERCEKLCIALAEMTTINPAFIQWYEVRKQSISFHNTPLEIATPFHERMSNSRQAWIFTSATISVNDDFSYFRKRLGIKESENACWDSPFDYPNNSLLYLPENLPEPSHPYFGEAVINAVIPVLEETQGKAFILFTSLAALNAAAEQLKETDYELFVQGTLPKSHLLEAFIRSKKGVLLGSASFWEGVDVKGEALSLVVIDKLPFASPADPIIKAKIANIREKGGEPFWQYQLPHAVISLKQGIGRLIRDESDRGILMVCDPRLSSKGYGKMFLDSLPKMPVTRRLSEVKQFWSKIREHEDAVY